MKTDVKTEPTFPAILNFSYANVIRPRGEIMLKQEKVHPWASILNLTDEEFVAKVGSTLEVFFFFYERVFLKLSKGIK